MSKTPTIKPSQFSALKALNSLDQEDEDGEDGDRQAGIQQVVHGDSYRDLARCSRRMRQHEQLPVKARRFRRRRALAGPMHPRRDP